MIIAVASGKGGTGKTTLATNLAIALARGGRAVHLLDCDVEEPNCHLFLEMPIARATSVTIPVPVVDPQQCDLCGTCAEVCRFNAIACLGNRVFIAGELCHGCGGCVLLCPRQAMTEQGREIGLVQTGWRDGLALTTGRLHVGEPMAPPLIRAVKAVAGGDPVLIDAPPGTSCPVVAAVRGVDFVILITEPTPFGLNDLRLAVGMVRQLRLNFAVVLNRSDAGDGAVEDYCRRQGIEILLAIPDDRRIAEAYSRGQPAVDVWPELEPHLLHLYDRICERTGSKGSPRRGSRYRPEVV